MVNGQNGYMLVWMNAKKTKMEPGPDQGIEHATILNPSLMGKIVLFNLGIHQQLSVIQ